ncbi:hypothetical protein [Kitasatospora sp. P5_F3]
MQGISEISRNLQDCATAGDSTLVPALAELENLSESILHRTDEHDLAMLLCLAGICSVRTGAGLPPAVLREVADRYADTSILYTGRVLPRIKEAIARLYEGAEEKSLEKLVEVADHISQGWPGYADSVFPEAFSGLARELSLGGGSGLFLETSFITWRRGLAECESGRPEAALNPFEASLEKYREFSYYADAAWLYADLVIARLTAGDTEAAARTADAQRRYVDGVIAEAGDLPVLADTAFAFHFGDVRSGGYSSFVDSATMGPQGLTPDDRALLRRYVRVSESLLSYARSHSERDLNAAVDLFSFGWQGYLSSPYPEIFRRLAHQVTGELPGSAVLLTAHVRWRGMLLASQLRLRSPDLIRSATELHERLRAAGLDQEADIALLDGGMLHFALYGKAATAAWLSQHLGELRERVARPLQAVVAALQVPPQAGLQAVLAGYLGARSLYRVPDFLPALGIFRQGHRSWREQRTELDLAVYGESLWINGVMIYESTPPALLAIFRELAGDLRAARAEEREVPYVPAAELAARTGRSASAIAQVVRRFRIACQEQFTRSTEIGIEPDGLLQGRPGYRLNPAVLAEAEFYLAP